MYSESAAIVIFFNISICSQDSSFLYRNDKSPTGSLFPVGLLLSPRFSRMIRKESKLLHTSFRLNPRISSK
ncbi:MAG: hypothetical protein EGQ00_09605 [Parabacteroides johnsonii]|nr:hypothetical protein [Parabacteroides johnsonii]